MPTITYGESAQETVLGEFGWDVDSDGFIIDSETGEYVGDVQEADRVHVDDVAGVVSDENDEPAILQDGFKNIMKYSEKQWRENNA